jgi:hypothetical protein
MSFSWRTLFNKKHWWVFIGFFTALLFSVISYIVWIIPQMGDIRVGCMIILSLPLFFITGIIAEIFNNSSTIISTGWKALLISLWEYILYFFTYWIGFEFIILKAWENPMFKYNGFFLFILPPLFLVISFIPMNLVGGFLMYGIRKHRRRTVST